MVISHLCSLWDGLLSGSDRILILGATNRIRDIDQAVLRRMPKQFPLYLPDTAQREKILTLVSWFGNTTWLVELIIFSDAQRYTTCPKLSHASPSRVFNGKIGLGLERDVSKCFDVTCP